MPHENTEEELKPQIKRLKKEIADYDARISKLVNLREQRRRILANYTWQVEKHRTLMASKRREEFDATQR